MSITLSDSKIGVLKGYALVFNVGGCAFFLDGSFHQQELENKKHMKNLEYLVLLLARGEINENEINRIDT